MNSGPKVWRPRPCILAQKLRLWRGWQSIPQAEPSVSCKIEGVHSVGSCLEISWKDAPTSNLSRLSFMFYPVDTRHDKSMRHFCTVRNSDVFSILQLMATLSLDQFPCHSSTSRMEHTWQQSRWYKSLVSHKAECIAVQKKLIHQQSMGFKNSSERKSTSTNGNTVHKKWLNQLTSNVFP